MSQPVLTRRTAPLRLPVPKAPTPMVFVMDPGFDVDDETALIVAAGLEKRNLISLKAVVATTDPSVKRAELTKGALRELGLPDVTVAVGDNKRPEKFNPHEERLEAPFLSTDVRTDAAATLREVLQGAPDRSVVMIVAAKMTDAATLVQAEPTLVQQKLARVVLMGGVKQTSEETDASPSCLTMVDGRLVANTVATNNRHDQAAADALYRDLQDLGVPTTVVTRKAATNTPISPDFFKELNDTGHPVAAHLRGIEGAFLNEFWQAAVNGQMGPERNKAWFLKTFCKPDTPDTITTQDDIRPYLKGRVVYDAVALLAGVPSIGEQEFDPVRVGNVDVIGLSQVMTGLKDPHGLGLLLADLAREGLRTDARGSA